MTGISAALTVTVHSAVLSPALAVTLVSPSFRAFTFRPSMLRMVASAAVSSTSVPAASSGRMVKLSVTTSPTVSWSFVFSLSRYFASIFDRSTVMAVTSPLSPDSDDPSGITGRGLSELSTHPSQLVRPMPSASRAIINRLLIFFILTVFVKELIFLILYSF